MSLNKSPKKTQTTVDSEDSQNQPSVFLKHRSVAGSRNVPRSSRAAGKKSVQKNRGPKEAAAFRRKINEISEAHRIKTLEMSDCLIASREGRFAMLETVSILGHMGLGCILIESSDHKDYAPMYDVVEIYEKKAAQDYEKAMAEYEKALEAYEAQEAAKAALEENPTELVEETSPEPSSSSSSSDAPVQEPSSSSSSDTLVQEPLKSEFPLIEDDEADESNSEDPSAIWNPTKKVVLTKPEKPEPPVALADYTAIDLFEEKKANCLEPMVYNQKKKVREVGNHISKLFDVVRMPKVGFFDFRVNGTKFIIPGTSVYRLVTPVGYSTKWYVVMGDVQMKSETLKSINPAYQAPDVIQEHMAMLDRIKAANKTTELDEDVDDEIPALVEELTA